MLIVTKSIGDVARPAIRVGYLDVVADDLGRNNLQGGRHAAVRIDLIENYLVVLVAIQVQRLRWYTVVVGLLAGA